MFNWRIAKVRDYKKKLIYKFGDLEYGGDDLTEVSMTLKYDWASLQPASGTPIPATAVTES